jgi:DNA-binding GntR family transcriptional regulator
MSDQPTTRVLVSPPMSELAVDALREMILNGTLSPGSRLNEVELAEQLGISRGPVREAIQRLSSEGLVVPKVRKGAFVVTFDEHEIRSLLEFRHALELFGARLAATRATADQLRYLEAEIEVAEQLLASDPMAPYPTQIDVHKTIVEMSGNSELISAAERVRQRLKVARRRASQSPEHARETQHEHRDMVGALVGRDTALATQIWDKHLEVSTESILATLLPQHHQEKE